MPDIVHVTVTDPASAPSRSDEVSTPAADASKPSQELSHRIDSIDVLRGLTILVMIFVNDLAGVKGAPAWMKHVYPHDADGMTFVDVVFPAFLFIVGVSIPFAIERRLKQRESRWRLWKHILIRTLGLLAIGVLMVNSDQASANGRLRPALWTLLMYIGVVLVWNTWPRETSTALTRALRIAGVALVLLMVVLYRGPGEVGFIEIRPYWWGILGLIGWAYLVACLVYSLFRTQIAGVVGAVALLYCVYLANAVGAFANLTWITRWVDIGSMLGSHAAITVSGVALGMMLLSPSEDAPHAKRIRWALLFGMGLGLAGYLLHTPHNVHRMFIINKIFATPPWCLLSSAITVWIWAAIYWLIDVRGWKSWRVALRPAGQNPLFAYILAPVLYALIELFSAILSMPNFFQNLGERFSTGFIRSVAFAFAVTWLAGALRRVGIWIKV